MVGGHFLRVENASSTLVSCTNLGHSMKNEIERIRNRLTKDFPELAYCGNGYTIKMLDDDLKNLGESSNWNRTSDCESEKYQFEPDLSLHSA
jgi:hypothetical protein